MLVVQSSLHDRPPATNSQYVGFAIRSVSNNADDVWPDWSADGSKIVFVRTKREQNDGFYTSNLFIINSDGTKEKQLTFETSFSGARTPDWRPSLDK